MATKTPPAVGELWQQRQTVADPRENQPGDPDKARVSFFANKFRKLGLIEDSGIEVHSSLLNAVLHDEPHIEI